MHSNQTLDLNALELGSIFLGSGGGSDPTYDLERTKMLFEKHGPAKIISLEEVSYDSLIVPIAFLGAPIVGIEKLPSGNEGALILKEIERLFKKPIGALVAGEIGGANAFAPLGLSAETKIPVLDADMIGRAFPEISMNSLALHDIPMGPIILVDACKNSCVIQTTSPEKGEALARAMCSAMGATCACSFYIMEKHIAEKGLVQNSLSQAIKIGSILQSSSNFASILKECDMHLIDEGIISHIQNTIEDGFSKGCITISTKTKELFIDFQNEFLAIHSEGTFLGTTPDIIALFDKETRKPLNIEKLRYGIRVSIVVKESPAIWRTEKGLLRTGPKAFGYNTPYISIKERI